MVKWSEWCPVPNPLLEEPKAESRKPCLVLVRESRNTSADYSAVSRFGIWHTDAVQRLSENEGHFGQQIPLLLSWYVSQERLWPAKSTKAKIQSYLPMVMPRQRKKKREKIKIEKEKETEKETETQRETSRETW